VVDRSGADRREGGRGWLTSFLRMMISFLARVQCGQGSGLRGVGRGVLVALSWSKISRSVEVE
jgi:hypothetical protein